MRIFDQPDQVAERIRDGRDADPVADIRHGCNDPGAGADEVLHGVLERGHSPVGDRSTGPACARRLIRIEAELSTASDSRSSDCHERTRRAANKPASLIMGTTTASSSPQRQGTREWRASGSGGSK